MITFMPRRLPRIVVICTLIVSLLGSSALATPAVRADATQPAPTATISEIEAASVTITTTRVSVASDGTQGNSSSGINNAKMLAISANGRYVAFNSAATNLVNNDTNNRFDVFVHDRQASQTVRVSVASDGTQGNESSGDGGLSISADSRYVTFFSYANNLVSGDTNGYGDVFVHDQQTGQTSRVSVASNGAQGNNISLSPSISADGRYLAFESSATNLVSGDTNGTGDVFVHDRTTGQTDRISIASSGAQGVSLSWFPSISADGRYVAFISSAANLVSGDTNGVQDVFVHDQQTGQTTRVSVASDGSQGNWSSMNPSISADGRYIAFESQAANLVSGDTNDKSDVFVHDRQTGQTIRVSVASDGTQGIGNLSGSHGGSISADGRYVAFESSFTNLVDGDTNYPYDSDVFVHDRQTGQTLLVSVANNGAQGNDDSFAPSTSANGYQIAFASLAGNLVNGDTNSHGDVFVATLSVSLPIPSLTTPANDSLTANYTPALDWSDTMPTPDNYQVQVGDNADFSSSVIDQSVAESTFTLPTPLNPNTRYYWRVRASVAGQFSPWSAVRSFRTAILPPVSNVSGGFQPVSLRPLFDWGGVSGASSYSLQVASDQNFTRLVLNLIVTPSAHVPTSDLPKGATLFWRVRANGTNGPSAWSRVRHFDSPNPPSVPTLLTPAHNATVANGQPTLDWSDSSPGVDHYEVLISTNSTFTAVLGRGRGGRTGVSQYTPEAALGTGTYYWRARAVNAQGQFSQWSAVRSFNVP